ncbi:nuclear transport factor 2 family protein [Flavobacterium sp. RHBU_24]|uniref:nuclear transport factor 2 family protein n=1 Tax=Flavobacterium sp. RHBU_24 TaxID=3391185 RepID=UPI0039848AF0
MAPKEVVEAYYRDMFEPIGIKPHLHPECKVYWNNSAGFKELTADGLISMIAHLKARFLTSRLELTHIIAEGQQVAVRYAHNITAPDTLEEITFAYSMAIWEIQDDKMYRGYIVSHLE